MGDATDAERLLEAYRITARAARDAEDVVKSAKKGGVWKPALATIVTAAGTFMGSTFAAGRYFESTTAKIDKIEPIEKKLEQHDNRITEAYNVCIASRSCCDLQCHRLDAITNVRLCP